MKLAKNWRTSVTGIVGYAVILINKYAHLDIPAEVLTGLVISVMALVSADASNTTKEEDPS